MIKIWHIPITQYKYNYVSKIYEQNFSQKKIVSTVTQDEPVEGRRLRQCESSGEITANV